MAFLPTRQEIFSRQGKGFFKRSLGRVQTLHDVKHRSRVRDHLKDPYFQLIVTQRPEVSLSA